jgi:hypothetical protein
MLVAVESVMLNPLVLIGVNVGLSQYPSNLSCSGDWVEKLRATSSLPFTLKTQISKVGECPMNEIAIRLFESGDQSVRTIREQREGEVLGQL